MKTFYVTVMWYDSLGNERSQQVCVDAKNSEEAKRKAEAQLGVSATGFRVM